LTTFSEDDNVTRGINVALPRAASALRTRQDQAIKVAHQQAQLAMHGGQALADEGLALGEVPYAALFACGFFRHGRQLTREALARRAKFSLKNPDQRVYGSGNPKCRRN
jgi:hypothetical protein